METHQEVPRAVRTLNSGRWVGPACPALMYVWDWGRTQGAVAAGPGFLAHPPQRGTPTPSLPLEVPSRSQATWAPPAPATAHL